jgi:hypothetical protein
MMELELTWTKLKRLRTDRAPSMIRKKTHLMNKINKKWTKKFHILHVTSLHHPPFVTLWRNCEV